jgi:hypothetical protein
MSSDPRRQQTPGWKGAGKPAGRKGDAQPQWKKESGPAPVRGRWSKKSKFGVALLCFLVISAALVWAFTWIIPPKPACLVLVGSGYEDNLAVPANVAGWNELQGFKNLTEASEAGFLWWGPKTLRLQQDPKRLKEKAGWDDGLKNVAQNTVVLFMAMDGAADSEGPCLILDEPGAQSRLRIQDVIARLADLPAKKNKVLVLDATEVPCDWTVGELGNDFERRLEELDSRIREVPNLVVISASGPGQRSWLSPDGRSTIFARYVLEGLGGAAGMDNGRVTALKLFNYASRHVAGWARDNRDAAQTPVLLPKDQEGERRAAKIDLVVIDREARRQKSEAAAPQEAPKISPELATAWQECQNLRKQVPAPWVDHPNLWREYLDTLLRYEDLLRAGDESDAAGFRGTLTALKDEMTRPTRLESIPFAFPMPEALGQAVPWSKKELAQQFEPLWNAEPDRRKENRDRLEKWAQGKGAALALTNVKVAELLLDKAAEDPAKNTEKAWELLNSFDRGSNARPAEAHFLAMLHRDLARGSERQPLAPGDQLQLALRTRKLAEEVALAARAETETPGSAYAEQIFPWIRDAVEAADKERRPGEDRLFLSTADDWAKSKQQLEQASAGYQKAQPAVRAVREALRTRDEVFASLPYYSRWMAERRAADPRQVEALQELWRNAHLLADALETPRFDRVTELSKLADLVRASFDRLARDFAQQCSALQDAPVLPSTWHDIEDALSVPLIDAAVRIRLLEKSREISRSLDEKFKPDGRDEKSGDADLKTLASKEQDLARDAAQRQGRLAMAALGEKWVNQNGPNEWDELHKKVTGDPAALDEAGDKIGRLWWRLASRVNELTAASRRSPLDKAMSELAQAERLARQLDGATVLFGRPAAASGVPFVTGDPVSEGHHLQLHQLLLWQEQRTFADHWFAEDPANATPYYLFAGESFLRDAAELAGAHRTDLEAETKNLRLARLKQAQADLRQPSRLRLAERGPQAVTSQRYFDVSYRVEGDRSVPPGVAAFWLEAPTFQISDPEQARRLSQREAREVPPSEALAYSLKNPFSPEPATRTITLHGRYRGEVLAQATPINLYSVPDVIATHVDPDTPAAIAARIDDKFQSQGGIVIVLDYTGSMERKIKQVTKAVKEVLEKIPRGTRVSIWLFGRKQGPGNTDSSEELTKVEPITKSPIRWEQNRFQIDNIMQELEASEPMNYSPVIEAMARASEDLHNVRGVKNLLVLTDGADNLFTRKERPESRELHRRHSTDDAAKFLKAEFADTDIFINVVLYKTEAGEQAEARHQFAVVEKLPLLGKVIEEKDADKLADTMQRLLRPKLRLLRDDGSRPKDFPEDGLFASFPEETDLYWSPGLDPGITYRASLPPLKPQNVQLDPGDRLELIATHREGQLGWERGVFGELFFTDKKLSSENRQAYSQNRDWLMALLQNQLKPNDRSLELMTTIEDAAHRAPSEGTVSQRKPKFIYFELEGAEKPVVLRYNNLADYPGPAWGLNVDSPSELSYDPGRAPVLRAFWGDRLPETIASFTRENSKPLAKDFKGLLQGVTLEASVEKYDVQPGVTESCLVVRARRSDGKPIMVRVPELKPRGQQHCLYLKAGEYTGRFWPVNETQAENAKYSIEVFSVDDFKRAASDRGARAEMKLPPYDRAPRPDPVKR